VRVAGLLFIWLLGSLSAAQSLAESRGAAAAASFQNLENAEVVKHRIETLFSDGNAEILVLSAQVNGSDWYRVVAVPTAGQGGRELVARLRQSGFPDAWFLSDYLPPTPAEPVSTVVRTADPAIAEVVPFLPTEVPTEVVPAEISPAQVAPAAKPAGNGEITLIDTLGGIPRHRFAVQTFREADIDVNLDGKVDESLWQRIKFYDEFMVAVPAKGTRGEYPTEMRVFATEKGLYVSAILYQPVDTLVQRLSVRDDFIDRDTFGFTIDATGEGLVGYWCIIALGGSVQDGKLLPERNYQRDWDGPWIGKSARRDDGWSAEMFFPWSMMNMPNVEGTRNVGFVATRQVSHKNERYQWPGHPYSSARFLSAFNHIEVDGVQPVPQLAMIPFASATIDEANDEDEVQVGIDITWKPSPKLELSATLNPDFGAVEADDVVLNLTAFETFFPEKRLFFLEGNEVFSAMPRNSVGNIQRIITNNDFASTSRRVFARDFLPPPISLVNTRRIGGTANQVTPPAGVVPDRGQRDIPTDLLGAMKLTGSIGKTRYGILGAFEDDVEWRGTALDGSSVDFTDDGRNFSVARFLYEDNAASRRSAGYMGTLVSGPLYDSYIHSLDSHFTSPTGRLKADAQIIMSDVDSIEGYGGVFDLMYAASGNLRHKIEFEYMDEEIDFNDLGFLRRNNYANARYILLYNKQRLTENISNYRTTIVAEQQYNITPGQVTNSGLIWRSSMVLPGRNTLYTAVGYLPESWEDIDSRGNGAYRVDARGYADILLATNAASVFSFSTSVGAEQEDLGDWTLSATAGVTIRPSDNIEIKMDVRYKHRQGWLVYQGGRNFGRYNGTEWQPSIDLNWFLAYNHQFRLSVQWVGVRANEDGFFAIPDGDGDLVPTARTLPDHDFTVSMVTAQLRYRWEIAPLTDFFLVYNRGNSLTNQIDSTFDDLFSDVFDEPIINSFVAKIRWRFGN